MPSRGDTLMNAALVALALCLLAGSAKAEAEGVQRGREFARANCARCHSIERAGESPFKPAPPFRTLHQRYPVEYLEEALAEGIVTGHSDMPEFRLEPDQIADFIDFLKALEE
jgi:cytochrome c